MVRLEAEVLMLNQKNPAKKEPGSYQEKQRPSDLASDEYGSQAAKRTARPGRGASGPASPGDIGAPCGSRATTATQPSRKRRTGWGEEHNSPNRAQTERARGPLAYQV